MDNKFPLVAVVIETRKVFTVTLINFDLEMVFNTVAQNGDGTWYNFDEVYLMENDDCELTFENLVLNSDANYLNYDKVDGDKTIYKNRYHDNPETVREQLRKRYVDMIEKDGKHIDEITRKIEEQEALRDHISKVIETKKEKLEKL